jgi:GNAT superfamily N-acetyltransferase
LERGVAIAAPFFVGAPMHVVLKPYEPSCREALCALWFDSYLSSGLKHEDGASVEGLLSRWDQEIASRWRCEIALSGGRLLGFAAYTLTERRLNQLFVDRAAQGSGVGKRLLDHVKAVFPDRFSLRTDVANAGGRRFYEREGMRLSGIGPHPRYGHMVCTYEWP